MKSRVENLRVGNPFADKVNILINVHNLDQEKVPQFTVRKCGLKCENQINFGPLAALERCEAFLLFLKKMLESGDVNISKGGILVICHGLSSHLEVSQEFLKQAERSLGRPS